MASQAKHTRTAKDRLKNPRLWLAAVVVAVAVAFIAQNREPVTISLLAVRLSAPQWLTLTVLFLAGVATGFLLRGRK